MSKLEVTQAGILSQFQDLGRFGAAQLGLSQGGASDLHAHCWANRLLGNSVDACVLEILMGTTSFIAHSDTLAALTGASMNTTLDGLPVRNWSCFIIKKGQTLKMGYAETGLRAYFAIKGGFLSPIFLNSSATVIRNKIGGLAKHGELFGRGYKLKCGDILEASMHNNEHSNNNRHLFSVPKDYIPDYADQIQISVLPSYQFSNFPTIAIETFFSRPFIVSQQTDRMGMRLTGEKINSQSTGIISEGIALGAIQVPPDGQPIILLNDRQTLGGYPKLGCVSKIDLSRLAQAKPGTVIHFTKSNFTESTKKWLNFVNFFDIEYKR
jgi:biotin-dependent carboxylase-like uncharacterized protein